MTRIFKQLLGLFFLVQGITNYAQTNSQIAVGQGSKEKINTVFLIGVDGLSVDGLTTINLLSGILHLEGKTITFISRTRKEAGIKNSEEIKSTITREIIN